MSLRVEAVQNIMKKIQHNEFPPNQIFTEQEICDELKMSRTPVREALIQLVSDNVLVRVPRKGYKISEIDLKTKQNMYDIIAILDALAATLAIDFITDEDLIEMNAIVDKIEISIKYKNYPEYYELQDLFHSVYVNKCDNEPLIQMIKNLSNGPVHRTYICEDQDLLFDILKEMNQEHLKIIDMFKNKERDQLEKFLKEVHWATKYPNMI